MDTLTEEERARYMEKGLQIMADGQFALVLLAGGQVPVCFPSYSEATRLKMDMVKGNCDFGFPSRTVSSSP